MRMRARLIYNPTSGHETLPRNIGAILHVLEQAGYEASAFRTTAEPLSAAKEARRAAQDGFELIAAAGGDGTVNEVVNGIAPLSHRPKMAVIPAGTTNDYARALKIPREDPVKAAEIILKKQTIKMDIGKANEKYFVNIAGGGLMTELTYDVPSEYKSILGYLAYVLKGAEMLPRVRPVDMKIRYDDGEYVGPASMFLLGLTNSMGGMEQISPGAALDDGNFSLIVVKSGNPVEILRLIAKVLNGGRHINDPKIIYTKAHKVVAETTHGQKMKINLDGEYGGNAPMTFINLQQHIEMYANVDEIPKTALSHRSHPTKKQSHQMTTSKKEATDKKHQEDATKQVD